MIPAMLKINRRGLKDRVGFYNYAVDPVYSFQ
jgi:hypothetical protein